MTTTSPAPLCLRLSLSLEITAVSLLEPSAPAFTPTADLSPGRDASLPDLKSQDRQGKPEPGLYAGLYVWAGQLRRDNSVL